MSKGWIGVDLEIDPLEVAWAAGFFDGEGSVFVRNTARHKGGTTGKLYPLTTVEMGVSQVRIEPIIRFHRIVGIGKIGGPYGGLRPGRSAYFRWNTAGRPSVFRVAQLLWPMLSLPKREQFHRCWETLRERRTPKSPKLYSLPELI